MSGEQGGAQAEGQGRKSTLRAVKAGEKAAPKKAAKTVAQAAAGGDRRELLVAMRDRIAKTVSTDCPPRDLAALTRRLQEIAREIEAIDQRDAEDGGQGVEVEDGDFDASAV